MGTIILWVIIAILFCANPALFFLGVVIFITYKGLSSTQPNKFATNQADSTGPESTNKNQDQTHTCKNFGRVEFIDEEDDPEVVKIREELHNHIRKNRAQSDEDILAEAEKEYTARKRAEELGQTT